MPMPYNIDSIPRNPLYDIVPKNGIKINKDNFPQIDIFRNGYAVALNSENKWGAFDKDGNIIIPFIYDDVWNEIDDNKFIVVQNRKYGIINFDGEIILPCEYTITNNKGFFRNTDFINNLFSVEKNGKCGFLNREWKEVIPCKYDGFIDWTYCVQIDMFEQNKLIVLQKYKIGNDIGTLSDNYADWDIKKQGVIDLNYPEKLFIPCEYDSIEIQDDRYFKVESNGKYGILNVDGEQILPCKFERNITINVAGFITVGLKVEKDNYNYDIVYGVFDSNGKEVISICYNGIDKIDDDGLVVVVKNSQCGIYQIGNGFIIPCQYDFIELFSEGLANICINKKWGCIDRNNNIVIPLQYERINKFSNGLAAVNRNGKWGVVNLQNKLIVAFTYDYIKNYSEGLAAVEKNKKWGFINIEGQVVIKCRFDIVDSFNEGMCRVRIFKHGSGYIDKNGFECGDWEITDNNSHNYTRRELDNLIYDAFEGDKDVYDEWSQR